MQWDKEVLEDLVDVVPIRVLHRGGGKLDSELVNQGPGHVLHEIVVCMSAGDFEVDDEHESERARDDDLVLRKLGHADVQGFPRVGLRGLKVMRLTVLSAFIAPRIFSECEGRRLGGTAIVYTYMFMICIYV